MKENGKKMSGIVVAFIRLCLVLMLALGTVSRSEGEPVLLTYEHVDILITYNAAAEENPLGLVVALEEEGIEYESTSAVLVVAEETQYILPAGTPFGEEGDPLWILAQTPQPELLFVGLSAEELPEGVFEGPVEIRLKEVAGPGDFYLWRTEASGSLDMRMNSRDGIDEADGIAPLIGGHEHANWGFSAPGVYTITFQVTGRRAGETTNITSDPIPFTFHVLPLPERPFEQWQREQFGEDATELVRAAEADPDGDGLSNVAEYAFGLNPLEAQTSGRPVFQRIVTEQGVFGGVRLARAVSATDIEIVVESAGEMGGPWEAMNEQNATADGVVEWVDYIDARPMNEMAARFYRVSIRFR